MKRPTFIESLSGAVNVFWCVTFLIITPACTVVEVNKTVIALPGAWVEMNSTTDASGNTQSPTVSPELSPTVDLVP